MCKSLNYSQIDLELSNLSKDSVLAYVIIIMYISIYICPYIYITLTAVKVLIHIYISAVKVL